jgi:quercetin dioxygenase-like cupin family protein
MTEALKMPDGTAFTVVESGRTNGGAQIVFEITMAPGAMGPPRHTHTGQEEWWTVHSGELDVQVGEEWQTIAAGETVIVPEGVVHTLKNRSAGTVVFHDGHRPALDFEDYIEDLDRLTRAGKLKPKLGLREMVYGSMVLVRHRPMQITAGSPQRIGETVLATAGRLLGLKTS